MTRFFLLLVFLAAPAFAQEFDHAHRIWDSLLKKHVVLASGGKASQVRYAEWAGDRAALKEYLAALSATGAPEFNAWSRSRRMAFLVNAYNAFTVELILAHYPVKSIRDIGGLLDDRWNRKFFSLFGKPASLNEVEHEMLRKPGAYAEPRVHFAVNCASIGCPMLREEAYVAEKLDFQLEEQTARFLSDRGRNRYAGGRLRLSRIFDWYKDDFAPQERFFARYAMLLADDPADRQRIADGQAQVSYLNYDWSLNEARR